MFLYISLVDMVPELNETVERASKVNSRQAVATFGLQNIGIILGIVCLYILARFQDDIQIDLWSESQSIVLFSFYFLLHLMN